MHLLCGKFEHARVDESLCHVAPLFFLTCLVTLSCWYDDVYNATIWLTLVLEHTKRKEGQPST